MHLKISRSPTASHAGKAEVPVDAISPSLYRSASAVDRSRRISLPGSVIPARRSSPCAKYLRHRRLPVVVPLVPTRELRSTSVPSSAFMHMLEPLRHAPAEWTQGHRHQNRLRKVQACSALSTYERAFVMIVRNTFPFSLRFGSSLRCRGGSEGSYALRRAVFCESGAFSDATEMKRMVTRFRSLRSMLGVASDRVVGTVRIHEETPGV
jgi:hypothetical protein